MLLHHGPYELPVARLRTRRPRAGAVLGDLTRWLTVRWTWCRPRAIPAAVALLGMMLVLAATTYLGDLARGESIEQQAIEVTEPVAHAQTLKLLGPDGEVRILQLPDDLPVIQLAR